MSIDISGYKLLYIETANEYLVAMQASVVLLEKNFKNNHAIEIIYRSAHTLKSQSTLMGYKNTASLNEFLEYTFHIIMEGKSDLNEKLIMDIKTAVKKIAISLHTIETLNHELSLSESLIN